MDNRKRRHGPKVSITNIGGGYVMDGYRMSPDLA
jgi:hypothetical protein